MKAAVYEKFQGPISIQNITDPIPKKDGVVVKVNATGLCRSDWHGWMGHDTDIVLPHVPGHELAGTIVEIGKKVKDFRIGDRVTVPFVCGCGNCPECQSGNQQVCDHQSQPGFTHFGSFAEYVALDYADTNLVKLPDEIDDATAATLGCRFITSFRAVVDQGKVRENNLVAIYGCGGVGLSAIMIAKALGAQVIAIDINNENLVLAKNMGADFIINAKMKDIVDRVKSHSNGGVHISIDALGSQETCFNSISSLRKRGKHIQVGLMTGDHIHPNVPMDQVIANELEIIGSHGMPLADYDTIFDLISGKKIDLSLLIERTVKLEDVHQELLNMDAYSNSGMVIIDQS